MLTAAATGSRCYHLVAAVTNHETGWTAQCHSSDCTAVTRTTLVNALEALKDMAGARSSDWRFVRRRRVPGLIGVPLRIWERIA